MRKINEIIIHCSATRPDWMKGQSAEDKVKEIRRWHVQDRGWSDIGYHYIIDRDGKVVEGRPIERAGAHTKGHNKNSIGVCLIGGHGSAKTDDFMDNFTAVQNLELVVLLKKLRSAHQIIKVSGHNEYANKACPGFDVQKKYGAEAKPRTSKAQSSTLQATAATGVAGATAVGTAVGKLDGNAQFLLIGCAVVMALGLAWIARRRIKRWAEGDR